MYKHKRRTFLDVIEERSRMSSMKMDLKSNRQRRRITIQLYDKYKKLLMQTKEELQPETQQQPASAAAPLSQAMDLNDLAYDGKFQ